MELATGPMPPRPPAATPTDDRHADAWGDFLRRVLVSVGLAASPAAAAAEPPPGSGFLSPPAAPSALEAGPAAE